MKGFSDDGLCFFQEQVLLIFHLLIFNFIWSSNKVFKDIKIFRTVHSRPFFRHQGNNLDWIWVWCCFQVFLYCLVQPNQDMHFLLHVIFLIRSDSKLFKQSTCTFYASEILFFKVFINACKLTGEMPIDWSFFLGVWHSVNSLSVSLTDWNLSWSSIHLVCL